MLIDESLYHYGTKGMKWGVRKKDDRSSTVGGADELVAPGLVLAYGATLMAVHMKQSGAFTSLNTKGKAFLKANPNALYKKNPEFARKDLSSDDILKKVVPGINPDYGKWGTNMNCRRATFAYEMRRRGYDVKATKTSNAQGQNLLNLSRITKTDYTKLDAQAAGAAKKLPSDRAGIFRELQKQPDGSRGEFSVEWKSPVEGIPGGGHSMAYEIVKGKPHIFDTQNGKEYKNNKSEEIFSQVGTAAYTRLDNADLDERRLARWVR